MGAGSSTRKITLINDETSGVIKLSESLAHRLRGQIEDGREKGDRLGTRQQENTIQKSASSELTEKAPVEQKDPGVDVTTDFPTWTEGAKEAHLMAARLREDKAVALKLKDEEWRRRLKEKEREYVDMANLTEEQLLRTAKEVESLFMKVSCSPVCRDHQDKVFKCYQANQNQSLRCSEQVENFARCVDLSRLRNLMEERAS